MNLSTFVPGRPAPQGSKRYVGNGISVESSKAVKPWRADIREHVAPLHAGSPLQGALSVRLEFVMPRPSSCPKRSTPPAVRRPDVDKLARAVLDALGSAGLWRDDAQVVQLAVAKRLAELGETPGCHICVTADEAKRSAVHTAEAS
jgi:crossover junction endodeoxyribonuclease RusA